MRTVPCCDVKVLLVLFSLLAAITGSGCPSWAQVETLTAPAPFDTPAAGEDKRLNELRSKGLPLDEEQCHEIRAIVAEQFQLQPAELMLDVSIEQQAPGANAFDIVEIIMNIEESLGVAIDDQLFEEVIGPINIVEAAKLLTLGNIYELAGTALARKNP